jgi:hypothetical protein
MTTIFESAVTSLQAFSDEIGLICKNLTNQILQNGRPETEFIVVWRLWLHTFSRAFGFSKWKRNPKHHFLREISLLSDQILSQTLPTSPSPHSHLFICLTESCYDEIMMVAIMPCDPGVSWRRVTTRGLFVLYVI